MKKVFDFNDGPMPTGVLGRPLELAWPCRMFRVTMPRIKRGAEDGRFNAFERCALKLLDCGLCGPKELAEEMCLPPDFVKAILLRLFDRGAIDKSYRVSDSAREELLGIHESETTDGKPTSETTEFETAVVFRECIGGSLLPVVRKAQLKSEEIDEQGRLKDKNNGKKIRLHTLHLSNPQAFQSPPEGKDVVAAVKTMSRQTKGVGMSSAMPLAGKITVSPDGEFCHLRATMLLQQSSEWRIRDPFGFGWSRELETAYMGLLDQDKKEAAGFLEWKKRNAVPSRGKSQEHAGERKPEPWDTPENRSAYPELLAALERSRGSDAYAPMEWALFYTLQRIDVSEILELLLKNTPETNKKSIEEAACELTGVPNAARHIYSPVPGKILSFRDRGEGEMQVVLPVALLAARKNDRFPFRSFLRGHPDCLQHILKIKELRDADRHADTNWKTVFDKEHIAFMQSFVASLLPGMRFPGTPPTPMHDAEAERDERLEATIRLQEFFGVSAFDRMDGTLRERLLRAEMFSRSLGDCGEKEGTFADAMPCLNTLAAAAQCAFRPLFTGRNPGDPKSDFAAVAEKRAVEAGWKELPHTLKTVRAEMVRQTLEGNDKTLGASAVAWLLRADDGTLRWAASRHKTLLHDLDTLLAKNKHGNQRCPMPAEELEKLCKSIYNLVKTITEA